MELKSRQIYDQIRSGGPGFIGMPRGLIAVWGKEAVQFLDGMITNDVETLADGSQMLAAFPNAQGRLLAVVRILREGDRFLIETEDPTSEKVFNNLFRFTYAGDFFVADFSAEWQYFEVWGNVDLGSVSDWYHFASVGSNGWFIGKDSLDVFRFTMDATDAVKVSDDLYESLRIESGMPKYGVDMDETTIVPELGLPGMVSYTKGCYIGQEIIARIHFRGHVAKQLTGLVAEPGRAENGILPGAELKSSDGKNAGRITSVTYSPILKKHIALAYVRYDYLEEGTELTAGDQPATVKILPFVG